MGIRASKILMQPWGLDSGVKFISNFVQVLQTLKLRPEHCRKGNFSLRPSPSVLLLPVAPSPLPNTLACLSSAPASAP